MTTFRCLLLVAIVATGCNPGPQPAAVEQPTDPKPAVAPKPEPPRKPEGDRVVLTERAAKQIRQVMVETPEGKYLRVRVADNQLKLDLDTLMDAKLDFLGESRGVPVVIDRKSATILPVGIVVDYIEDGETKGFKFRSPGSGQGPPDANLSLADARKDFQTTLRPQTKKPAKTPALKPPENLFQVVQYEAPLGKNTAYLSPDPKDGKKHPAIV